MISLSADWFIAQGDCSLCYFCKEQVIGNMYEMKLVVMEKPVATLYRACEACYFEQLASSKSSSFDDENKPLG